MLAARPWLALRQRRLQCVDEHGARAAWLDDLVHVAALGGDEFALVLPGRSEQEGLEVAAAVVRRLATIESAPGERISVSAGTATFPEHGSERSELYRLADDALYLAKAEGKSRVRAARRAERDSAPVAITR